MIQLVINDCHLGAIRSAGTTPVTQWQLREYLMSNFQRVIDTCQGDMLINGDLFDTFSVPLSDLFRTYETLHRWLAGGHKLWLAAGNHDLSKNSQNHSSFAFLGRLLVNAFPKQVTVVTEPLQVGSDYVVPHMLNQDLLEHALSKVPPDTRYLFVHANYNNNMAAQQDHSLNISQEQAESLPVDTIIFGHIHQGGQRLNGKVVLVGNQFPSSIADCLGNDTKRMLEIGDNLTFRTTWDGTEFVDMPWTALTETGAKFVRVSGSATPDQAADAVTAISRFRQRSEALIVTNAVRVEGEELKVPQLSLESLRAFNIHDVLSEHLSPQEMAIIRTLK